MVRWLLFSVMPHSGQQNNWLNIYNVTVYDGLAAELFLAVGLLFLRHSDITRKH